MVPRFIARAATRFIVHRPDAPGVIFRIFATPLTRPNRRRSWCALVSPHLDACTSSRPVLGTPFAGTGPLSELDGAPGL
jgi:hypothetical protein